MSRWLEQIETTIRERKLFRDGQGIVVAVSGGMDSMVLLCALKAVAEKHRWKLVVAHFNHKLRGAEADADEELVRKTAAGMGLRFVTANAQVKHYASEQGVSVEMAARSLRHEFLARTAREHEARSIALAHHAGDQVELFFLRILRGTGGTGLGGMKWCSSSPEDSQIELVRPLLGFSKSQLHAIARENGIAYSEDATNAAVDILRNRVRQELIQLLEKHYQPGIAATVLRTMEIVGAETEVVAGMAREWLEKERWPIFGSLPTAVQRQIIQLQLIKMGHGPDFERVEWLRLNPGCVLSVSSSENLVCDEQGRVESRLATKSVFSSEEQKLAVGEGGTARFGGLEISWSLALEVGTQRAYEFNVEQFDADKVGGEIQFRFWQPGDRFWPIGASASSKLQDLFTNLKVPQAERHERVVAAAGNGELFWVEGLRISESFKLDKRTERRLKWTWRSL